MNKNTHIYVSVKIIIDDKLTEMGKSKAFKNAVYEKYLDTIIEVVDEAIDNELEFLTEQSNISKL